MTAMARPEKLDRATKLIADYEAAEKRLEDLQQEIMREIREKLGTMTPYQFSAASGINKGNLYALISNGKWNTRVALEALFLLNSPISDDEIEGEE